VDSQKYHKSQKTFCSCARVIHSNEAFRRGGRAARTRDNFRESVDDSSPVGSRSLVLGFSLLSLLAILVRNSGEKLFVAGMGKTIAVCHSNFTGLVTIPPDLPLLCYFGPKTGKEKLRAASPVSRARTLCKLSCCCRSFRTPSSSTFSPHRETPLPSAAHQQC
jgi:hypothetical protein